MLRKKKLSKMKLLVTTIILLISISAADGYEKGKLHLVVYFNPDVTVEDPVTAVSAMRPFADYLGHKIGVKFEPYFFKRKKDLENFLNTRKVSVGFFSQLYIVENFRKRNFVPTAVALKEGQPYYRKVILVRKDSSYQTLQDLSGKTLATTSLGEDNIPFLNKVIFRGEIDVSSHFGKLQVVDTANSAVMALLYKQVDAAAANYLNFIFLQELNPQVGKQLKSIYTSARTPLPGMVFFKDNVPQDFIDLLTKEMLIMHESPTGQQVMLTFQVDAFGPATIETWTETARLMGISLDGSTKESPVKPPAETETGAVSTEKPRQLDVTPRKPALEFERIQAVDDAAQNQIVFEVSLLLPEQDLAIRSVKVHYSFATGDKGEVTLNRTDQKLYRGSLTLPESSAPTAHQKTKYVVKSGDTLGKIARKFLGDSRKYMLIASFNKIKDPNIIYVGQKLTITSGEFSGYDINYTIMVTDNQERRHQSASKFISVIR